MSRRTLSSDIAFSLIRFAKCPASLLTYNVTFKESVHPVPRQEADGANEYASEVLSLARLLIEFNDAVREGDGSCILRCWRYFLSFFKASDRRNYCIEAFTLLAQEKYLLSPRMAMQLKWSWTINIHGRPGKNISADSHMEHLNLECKQAISGLGANSQMLLFSV